MNKNIKFLPYESYTYFVQETPEEVEAILNKHIDKYSVNDYPEEACNTYCGFVTPSDFQYERNVSRWQQASPPFVDGAYFAYKSGSIIEITIKMRKGVLILSSLIGVAALLALLSGIIFWNSESPHKILFSLLMIVIPYAGLMISFNMESYLIPGFFEENFRELQE